MITPPAPSPAVPPAPKGGFAALLGTRLRFPGGLEISFFQAILVAAIVFYALAIPGDFHFKLTAMGFGVCHQISSHSYFIDSHQLPLCSRCSGIYLGALASFVLLALLRRRATGLPMGYMLGVLGVFFGAMAIDGLDSTLQTFGAAFYQTNNMIRLFTGALAGIAVTFMVFPVLNFSLWSPAATKRESVLEQPFELAAYMVATGVLVALVLIADDWLYYPVAILSVAGMLALLTVANIMIVLLVTRREATYTTFSAALTPILLGLLISLIELTLLAWGRESLAPFMQNNLGMPIYPGLP